MKLYEFIENLQKLNPNKVVMVKSGAFFNSIGKDAVILEKILGFKRTCFAKGLCKVGMPVAYVRQNIEKVKERLKEKNISIIIYDEIENGRYKYKDKSYDILLEIEGEKLKQCKENIDCSKCKNNIYLKEANIYTILKEEQDNFIKRVEKIIQEIK